jgi:hypothetical protein
MSLYLYRNKVLAIVLFIFLEAPALYSQNDTGPAYPVTAPVAVATRARIVPLLDGRVLDDPAYADAQVLDQFWQTTPDEGAPASERTEVRIVFTAETLFVGVVCYDRQPSGIIISDSRRDGSLEESDSFQMILDTFYDRQNGFIFATTPAGNEFDAQISNEGELSVLAMRSGSSGGFNLNWDGSWRVKTLVDDHGWSAEFAIPFRTLRFDPSQSKRWGVNFQRSIRRRKEAAYWSPLPRQFTLYRVSRAGTLEGLELPSQQNFKVIPYVLGKTRTGARRSSPAYFGSAGLDAKYSLTQSMTLDVTLNTDFAQVEVDDQQVNLDRFDLFFPEKRPFFLENAGNFDFGSPGEVEIFFSRRIGIHGPTGSPVPILGGVRLSGKIGSTKIGFLDMQTKEVTAITPANNFAVARLSHELPNRTSLGVIAVNRHGTGSSVSPNDYNRTLGIDGRLGLGDLTQMAGFAVRSFSPGGVGRQHAFRFGVTHNSPSWIMETHYTEVGENFNPEVGFLRRRGYRKMENLILHRYRPHDFIGLHEMRPHISYRSFWDFSGFQETAFMHLDSHWEWKNGWELHTGVNVTKEGVKLPFQIYPNITVPAGTYNHSEAQIVLITNQAAPLTLRTEVNAGGFFGGSRFSKTSTLRYRTDGGLTVQLAWNRNDVSLPVGYFVTNILRTRLMYYFSPQVFLQSLVQYNDRTNTWSANLRFGWLQAANTGLFIVINELHDFGPASIGLVDRNIVVKYTQVFDVLE